MQGECLYSQTSVPYPTVSVTMQQWSIHHLNSRGLVLLNIVEPLPEGYVAIVRMPPNLRCAGQENYLAQITVVPSCPVVSCPTPAASTNILAQAIAERIPSNEADSRECPSPADVPPGNISPQTQSSSPPPNVQPPSRAGITLERDVPAALTTGTPLYSQVLGVIADAIRSDMASLFHPRASQEGKGDNPPSPNRRAYQEVGS